MDLLFTQRVALLCNLTDSNHRVFFGLLALGDTMSSVPSRLAYLFGALIGDMLSTLADETPFFSSLSGSLLDVFPLLIGSTSPADFSPPVLLLAPFLRREVEPSAESAWSSDDVVLP